MTSVEPQPAAKFCTRCGSRFVKRHRDVQSPESVTHKLVCTKCRNEMIYWTGTALQEKAFLRKGRYVQRVMDAAARRLSSSDDAP
jgi:ribosomal protein S27AE